MRWLMHGNLTSAVGEALVRHGHSVKTSAECGLAEGAELSEVLQMAKAGQLDIITNDAALVDAIFELDLYMDRSIVFLQLPGQEVEQDDAIDRLFARYKRLTPNRLYSITETRVKIRQLPHRI